MQRHYSTQCDKMVCVIIIGSRIRQGYVRDTSVDLQSSGMGVRANIVSILLSQENTSITSLRPNKMTSIAIVDVIYHHIEQI